MGRARLATSASSCTESSITRAHVMSLTRRGLEPRPLLPGLRRCSLLWSYARSPGVRASRGHDTGADVDPELNKEVLDVRKVIEKSTSKVSLRDLEKKGFRQVKVLRAGDINQLIFKAVQNVLAKAPKGAGMSEEERERIVREARADVDAQMAQMREMQSESQRIEEAHKNLEAKLAEVNKQLAAEKAAVQRDRQAFQQERQQLFDKGMAGQQAAEQKYQGQLEELRERLMQAES